jgi:hypothetical protein
MKLYQRDNLQEAEKHMVHIWEAQISTYVPSQPQQKSTKDGKGTYLGSLQNRQNSGEIVVWCNLPWDPQTRHLL